MGQEFQVVVAQAPREVLKRMTLTQSGTVPASGSANTNIFSSPNTIARVKELYFNAAGVPGSTGSHVVTMGFPFVEILKGGNLSTANITFSDNYFKSTNGVEPNDLAALGYLIKNIEFDSIIPLSIAYYNQTNAAQNTVRDITIIYVERQIS